MHSKYTLGTQKIITRRYEPGDEDQIVGLLGAVFNGWPQFDLPCKPVDHWKWKYLDNHLNRNRIILAETEGKIIGTAHSIFLHFKVGDNKYLTKVGYDVGVHPDYRGKGVYSKILAYTKTLQEKPEWGFTVDLTNNKILVRQNLEGGLTFLPKNVRNFIRIRDIEKFLQSKAHGNKFLKRIGYWVLSLGNNLVKKTVVAIDAEVSIITRFENSVKRFLEKVESEYNFILARSMEYLNWRYCDPRGGDYVVFQASTVDEIVGYMVVRVVKQDTGMRGVIVDSLVHPGRTDVLRLLLGSACDYFDKYDINEVTTWLVDSHPDNRVFKECGFIDTRNGPYVFMGHQDIGTNREKLANSSARQIHFKIGDTDWI